MIGFLFPEQPSGRILEGGALLAPLSPLWGQLSFQDVEQMEKCPQSGPCTPGFCSWDWLDLTTLGCPHLGGLLNRCWLEAECGKHLYHLDAFLKLSAFPEVPWENANTWQGPRTRLCAGGQGGHVSVLLPPTTLPNANTAGVQTPGEGAAVATLSKARVRCVIITHFFKKYNLY